MSRADRYAGGRNTPPGWVIAALLVLATLHAVRSVFFTNASWVNLKLYELGQALNPYQTRALMVPVLRWAAGQAWLRKIAAWQNRVALPAEPYSAEKVLCVLLAGVALLGTGLLVTWVYRRRGGARWWLPWALLLEVVFTSYAARSAQANWYPYDFPNLLFCALAAVGILERRWWVLAVLMPLATANRETTICWAVIWVFAVWREQGKGRTIVEAGLLAALWAVVYLPLKHHYVALPLEMQTQRMMNLRYVAGPWSWPQLFSALGYLPWLILACWRRISERNRRILLGVAVSSLPILWRGLWTESRIFLDFAPLTVVIAAELFEPALQGWTTRTEAESQSLNATA